MLQALLDFSPDAIIGVNREGRILLANLRAENMFGYNPDELIGKSVEALIPERLRDEHPQHRAGYMTAPSIRPMGARLDLYGRRKDGSEFPVDISLSPLDGADGLLVISAVRDISRLKQVEKDLKALNAIASATNQSLDVREILNLALDKVLEVTGRQQGYIRLKNPLTGEVTLAAQRGISDRFVDTLLHARTSGGKSDRVFETGKPIVINDPQASTLKAETLREGFRSVAWIPMRARGKVLGVLNVATSKPIPFLSREVDLIESIGSVIGNAVENARLFEEAQRNLERIRALYEINLAITATLDLRSSMAILLEKIDSLLGYPTVLTMRFLEDATQLLKPIACRNLDEEEWKAYSYSISPSAFRASAVINKAPLIVSDIAASPGTRGPSFYRQHGLVSFLGIPLVAQEKVIGVLSVYTKEKHTFTPEEIELISAIGNQAAIAIHNAQLHEETKRQAEVAERANKVKSEFLSIMSHELRTPLTVVMGYGELMQQGALGDLSQKQADALQKMMSRSKDLLGLINGILEATRLESQAAKLESSQVSLSDLLEDLKSQYAGLKGKELRIEWDYPLELPQIRTDGAKLKQILENLVNNAIKFTDRGSVTVTAGVGSQGSGSRNQGLAESGHLTPDTRWVEFKITDTGIGIPMEALPFIFERFRQVDSSDTRFHGGVGLGLYIAKRFAELLGGTISVKSEPGKGSTFTVTIPNPNT